MDIEDDCFYEDMEFNFNSETVTTTWFLDDGTTRLLFKKPMFYNHEPEGICALGCRLTWSIMTYADYEKLEKPEYVNNEPIFKELPDFLTCVKNVKECYEAEYDTSNHRYMTSEDIEEDKIRQKKEILLEYKFKIKYLRDYEKIMKFINNHSYDYFLDKKELYDFIYDFTIQAEKNKEYQVANRLIDKFRIVKYNDSLYMYHDDRYQVADILTRIIQEELEGQKVRYVNEVIKQVEACAPIVKASSSWVIKCKNGCLYDGQWIDVDYTDFTPYYIDLAYYPNVAAIPAVDNFLDTFTESDRDYSQLILEMIGHCLITDLAVKRFEDFQKLFIFKGNGKNGKGVLMNVMRTLLGENNVSTIPIDKIADERYLYALRGKLANISDDLKDTFVDSNTMKTLKNLAAFDPISNRKLYGQAESITLSASLIFSTNHTLKTNEKGEAWKRRLITGPAFAKPKVKDPHLEKKLTSKEALEYWWMLVVNAYIRLYEKRTFTHCQRVIDFTEQYHEENNAALAWVRAKGKEYFINKQAPEVYEDYKAWHIENIDKRPMSAKQVKETILDFYGLVFKDTTVNKKTGRYYKEK